MKATRLQEYVGVRFPRRAGRSAVTALVALTCGIATVSRAQTVPAFGSAVWGGIGDNICASPEGSFNFLNGGPCFYSTSSPPLAAGGSLSDSESTASAQASLALGSVSVTAAGNTGGQGFAHALIWDTLTFSGAAPGAVATITMSGAATAQGNATFTNAIALLLPLGVVGSEFPDSLLEGNYSGPVGSGSYDLQQVVGISNNVPMLFAVGVDAYASSTFVNVAEPDGSIVTTWYSSSATVTDPFSFELPAGVTFTSASGAFPSDVPEPATFLLMVSGLVGLGWSRRRRHA